jgi:hypothetical protein
MRAKYVRDGTNKSRIGLRLPEADRKSLELMAMQEQISTSDMMRILIREGAKSRSILPTDAELCREGVILGRE